MRISAKVEYAVMAAVYLAQHRAATGATKSGQIASVTGVPSKFLEAILLDLRRAGIVTASRGPEGGYQLARSAAEVTVADLIRAVEGPLAEVRGVRPELVTYPDGSGAIVELWVALRVAMRSVLERVSIADLAGGRLPSGVRRLLTDKDAWHSH